MDRSCAKCSGAMSPFQPRPGIQVAMCRSCKGLWFPKGMLARQLQASQDLPGRAQTRATSYPCRSCGNGHLIEVPFADDPSLMVDTCPNCGGVHLDANELGQAMEIARRARTQAQAKTSTAEDPAHFGAAFADLVSLPRLFVKQRKEWLEILTDWETRNKYDLVTEDGRIVGHVAEHGTGIGATLIRLFFKTRRPFEANVWDARRQLVLRFSRPFYWFFSDIFVETAHCRPVGSVHRRFKWLGSLYDIRDPQGRTIGTIRQSFWRIWRFTLVNRRGQEVGEISKRWSGLGREFFTSADTFQIAFGNGPWSASERAVILAAAISIDLDRFEQQTKGNGGLLGDGMNVLFD